MGPLTLFLFLRLCLLACHLLCSFSFFFLSFSKGGRPPGSLAWEGKPGRPGVSWSEPGGSRWPGGESPTLGEIPGHVSFFSAEFPFFFLITSSPEGEAPPGCFAQGVSQGAPGSTRIDGEPGGSQRPGGESPTLGEMPGHICFFVSFLFFLFSSSFHSSPEGEAPPGCFAGGGKPGRPG